MRTCVWCQKPLPEPQWKGHRRRQFCNDRCKQRFYLFHKQMAHDAAILQEPYWKLAYSTLKEQFKWLEQRMQERVKDIEEMQQQIERLERLLEASERRNEDYYINYLAKLKALGVSEKEIQEFEAYWKTQAEE